MRRFTVRFLLTVLALTCALAALAAVRPADRPAAKVRWAIAIHGGAGVSRALEKAPEAQRRPDLEGLRKGLSIGKEVLAKGGSALDACEQVCRYFEEDPNFNAGKG